MSSRRTALGVAVWAAVVLVGSTLVWVVISRVGAEASDQLRATQPAPFSVTESTKPAGSEDRSRSSSARPSGNRTSPAGATGSGEEPTERPPAGSQTPREPASSSSAPDSPAGGGGGASGQGATNSDTWSGSPGTVRATCRGTTLADWSGSPDLGWKLETEWEDGDLRAHFEQGEDGREVEVTVTCTASGPTFHVQDES